jgi:hypothetical protein
MRKQHPLDFMAVEDSGPEGSARILTLSSARSRPAHRLTFLLHMLGSEERTDMMSKVARLLAALAVVLATLTGCRDLYCCVPKGGKVNVLGDQNNR